MIGQLQRTADHYNMIHEMNESAKQALLVSDNLNYTRKQDMQLLRDGSGGDLLGGDNIDECRDGSSGGALAYSDGLLVG